eukprot:g2629.t1
MRFTNLSFTFPASPKDDESSKSFSSKKLQDNEVQANHDQPLSLSDPSSNYFWFSNPVAQQRCLVGLFISVMCSVNWIFSEIWEVFWSNNEPNYEQSGWGANNVISFCMIIFSFSLIIEAIFIESSPQWVALQQNPKPHDQHHPHCNSKASMRNSSLRKQSEICKSDNNAKSNNNHARSSFSRGDGIRNGLQKKCIVYCLELIISTLLLFVILVTLHRIYIEEFPTGCTTHAPPAGLSRVIRAKMCVGINQTMALSRLDSISGEELRQISILQNHCLFKNWWLLSSAFTAVVCLYLFEIIYLSGHMRLSLVIHHLSAIALVICVLESSLNTTKFEIGIIHAGFSILEQPTFLALLLYRLHDSKERQRCAFLVAWIWFGLSKTLSHAWTIFLMISEWDNLDPSFQFIFLSFTVSIGFSQYYSVYAQYLVWRKLSNELREELQHDSDKEGHYQDKVVCHQNTTPTLKLPIKQRKRRDAVV